MAENRGQWGSRFGFILAAAGSAVGLGNIWKFPYITGENGGGLFVLIYLACILLVGPPIMVNKIMIGRAAQKQPVAAIAELTPQKKSWTMIGWLGVLAGFVILSYYQVVAGWAMDYTVKSFSQFSKSIHQEAQGEATAYRAQRSIDEMRADLAANRAARTLRRLEGDIKRNATASQWGHWNDFLDAKKALPAHGQAAAREALLTDEAIREAVEVCEPLVADIEDAKTESMREAKIHFGADSQDSIREAAVDLKRRQVVSKGIGKTFGEVIADGWTTTFWMALFMLMTMLVVAGGISKGIERWCRILMPTLFGIICFMVVYGAFQPGFGEAVSFVFKPDMSKLHASGVLEALGHAFFTLSLGMGAMITYGSYQKSKGGLLSQSITIAGLDTVIALLACMMMFPIIFSYGQDPSAGPGLVFVSMPLAFAEIGRGGMLLSILFFSLLVFAALTSAISLLEVVVSYFVDVKGWTRRKAALILGGAIFIFGLPSAFCMGSGFLMDSWEPTYGMNFFDTMDYLASNWMLPIGGLLVSIYAGWVLPKRVIEAELSDVSSGLIMAWTWLVRFVAPILVLVVLMQKVGIIEVT